MKFWFKAYAAALVTIAVLDALWLGIFARWLYARELGHLMADEVRVLPALLFYIGYPAGLVWLALVSRLQAHSAPWRDVAVRGAVVGAIAYGTYDLTNLATLTDWSALLSVVDMAWGIALSAVAAVAAKLLTRRDTTAQT